MAVARKKSRRKGKKPGPKIGSKSIRKAKGIVKGSPVAARREIRPLIRSARLGKVEAKSIEKQYVALGTALDQLEKLALAGTATAADKDLLFRAQRSMARIKGALTAEIAPVKEVDIPDATDRVAFCEEHLTVADGSSFSIAGREWQRDRFWSVLDGFRLWPVDHDRLCDSCRGRAGHVTRSVYDSDESRSAKHARKHGGCRGMHTHVIWLLCLQLKRQQGKTTGVAGYAISSLFRYAHESIAYIAGSEDQSESLFRVNFGRPVAGSEKLGPLAQVMRTRMVVPSTGSEFELFPTSLAGTTGGTRTLVIVDEARDVPSSIFSAFVPQVYARNGWRCPTGLDGHAWSSGDLVLLENMEGAAVDPGQDSYGQKCNACGQRTEPWVGRVVVMSSAQELDGSSGDWFHDLCETLEAEPQPDAYCYRTSQVINPKVSRQIVSRTEAILGKVPGLSDTINIEAGGVSRRKGDPFLTGPEIAGVVDASLGNQDGGSRAAVAFLDCSSTVELTSFVLFEDDHLEGEHAWHRIAQARLDWWDPKNPAHCPTGVIDKAEIRRFLDRVVPRFGLVRLTIDTRAVRAVAWARELYAEIKADKKCGYRNIVKDCPWQTPDRRAGWAKLEERVISRTIRIFDNDTLRAELNGARRFRGPNGEDIREPNRRVNHLDIAEGVASCCLLVHQLSMDTPGIGLAQIMGRRSDARDVLATLRRRRLVAQGAITRGIGPDGF